MNAIIDALIIIAGAGLVFAAASFISDKIMPEPKQELPAPRSLFTRTFSEEEVDHIVHQLGMYDAINPLTPRHAANHGLKQEIEAHINSAGVSCYISLEDWDTMIRYWYSLRYEERAVRLDLMTLTLIAGTHVTNV